MRQAGLKSLLFWGLAFVVAGVVAGCDNPFDPLQKSDKIQGLTYFDFTATQEHWDSDPEWDGLQISMGYYNEYGDSLSFHDKPHKIQVELWSQKTVGTATNIVRDKLLASKTVEYSNSDDFIRIPIDYYAVALPLPSTESIKGFVLMRLYPPLEYPQKELLFLQGDVELYTPEPDIILP